MMNEERRCCICDQKKKFLAIINTGKKYYCMQCETKINREYGKDYWKPCTMEEGFKNLSSILKKDSKNEDDQK